MSEIKVILSRPVRQKFSTWEEALVAARIDYMSYGWWKRAFGAVIVKHWVDYIYFSVTVTNPETRERHFYYD